MLKRAKETQEHTQSYYAATRNYHGDYPQLEGDIRTDVVVVGGGFTGVNTALELAERGFKVALLEANRIGWGATGRNGGQVIGGIGHNIDQFKGRIGQQGVDTIKRAGVECCEIVRERVAKFQLDCDLKWGYVDVAIKQRELDDLKAWADELRNDNHPYEVEIVDGDTLRNDWVNSDRYVGGLVHRDGFGHVHPLNLCLGEAAAAAGLGVEIYEQTAVEEIVQDATPVVRTAKGSVTANYVVLCGNAYMGRLVPQIASKVLPATSCVIATEPLGERAMDVMRADVAVCDQRTALDYYRLSADKRMLFGGLSNYTGLEPSDLTGTLRKNMAKVFPELADVRIDYAWSGQMGIGINRMPQLGAINGNIFYAQAYSGHGVAPSHLTARVTAEAVSQQASRHDVFSRIKHWSWPGGELLGRPGMALGMLWYKMKDAL